MRYCPYARATTVVTRGSICAAPVSHRPHDSHDSHDSARLPKNVARNSHVNLLNFEIGSLIFRGFQGVIQETRWGITCEIYRDPSTGSAGPTGSAGSAGSTASSGARGHRLGERYAPNRRPIAQNSPKIAHFEPMGLHFGEISVGNHPHQHATTADTTLTTESTARPHPSARSTYCRHHLGDRGLARG